MHEEFRQDFGRGLTIGMAVLTLVSAVVVGATSGFRALVLTLPWLALLVVACWAFFWRPSVVVSDAGVRLVNVTRTIDVPWPAVQSIETRFALTLHTEYGRFAAWAAPAPGAGSALRMSMRSRRARSNDPDDDTVVESTSVGDIRGSASGEAAIIVRRKWDQLRADGHLDDPRLEFEKVPAHWHWRVGALVLGLVILSVATLVLG